MGLMGEGWEGVTLPASSREMRKHSADRGEVPIGRSIAHFVCHEARLTVEIDGVHKTIADALSGITPLGPSPIKGPIKGEGYCQGSALRAAAC
jgi:hypothetical protein